MPEFLVYHSSRVTAMLTDESAAASYTGPVLHIETPDAESAELGPEDAMPSGVMAGSLVALWPSRYHVHRHR